MLLIHWGRVAHMWLVAWTAPSPCLNQCWNIVGSNPRYKLQWNLKQNSFSYQKKTWKCLWNGGHFISASMLLNRPVSLSFHILWIYFAFVWQPSHHINAINWQIDGSVQVYSNYNVLVIELLQSCTKPSTIASMRSYPLDYINEMLLIVV